MNAARRTILIGSSALLLTALLTGCGAANGVASGGLGALIPTAPTAKSTETPTPAAIPGDTDGNGRLSEFEKQILASHAPKNYTMPDGSVVQVDPTQQLPAPVVAAIQEKAAPIAAVMRDAEGQAGYVLEDIRSLLNADAEATGRGIIFVFQSRTLIDPSLRETKKVWSALASSLRYAGIPNDENKEAFLAAVNAWATPRNYEVIVIG